MIYIVIELLLNTNSLGTLNFEVNIIKLPRRCFYEHRQGNKDAQNIDEHKGRDILDKHTFKHVVLQSMMKKGDTRDFRPLLSPLF